MSTSAESSASTAIIVTWNCEATLANALRAVSPQVAAVICVDNASQDRSLGIAEAHGAATVGLDSNTGFPHAVNVVLDRVRTDYVLLLNPDVEVREDCVVRCVNELESDPGVGLVGANLRQPDGQSDLAAARRFRTLPLLLIETLGLPRLSRRFDLQYFPSWDRSQSRDVPCINGAFMLMRTELLRDIGGLDETAFLYLEDQELCRQVAARGLRVRFVADAIATHQVSAATRAASADQQAVAFLHRMDANIEIINRLHGRWARRAAVLLWAIRCSVGVCASALTRDRPRRHRYRMGLTWLAKQGQARVAPPPVP